MGWTTLISLGDINENLLTEKAKEKIREHPPSKTHPLYSLLSIEDIEEEYLTEKAKKWIIENKQNVSKNAFEDVEGLITFLS